MITFSEAQLQTWLATLLWPFFRVLAIFSVAPVFSSRAVPVRTRLALALLITMAVGATPQGAAEVALTNATALATLLQQLVIGVSIGFLVRLVLGAVELAGELIGLQMGLNFAAFFDMSSNAPMSAVSRYFGQTMTMLFLSLNGHLLVIAGVIKSFEVLPIGGDVVQAVHRFRLHEWGGEIFAAALWISLPVLGMLLMVNLVLGVVSRVAPQINVFSLGFPVTLTAGLVGIALMTPTLEQPFVALLEKAMGMTLGG